jgi:hypothetical protein
MLNYWRSWSSGFLALAFVLGLAPGAWSQVAPVPGGLPAIGGSVRGILRITGKIICVDCSADEVRRGPSRPGSLYEFDSNEGRVVINVTHVNNRARWEAIAGLTQELTIRAPEPILEELTAEENLFREVEITGLLRSTRVVDVGGIRFTS